MIAKGTTISHGLEALNYAVNKPGSKILGGNHLYGDCPENWHLEMSLLHEYNSRLKRGFLRFEISPSEKEAEKMKSDADWKGLAAKFLEGMSLQNHQCVIALHQDKKHKHLHIIVNRVSVDEKVYNDKFIGKKAGEVVGKISAAVGWENVNDISKRNKYQCWCAVNDVLKEMNQYEWNDFKKRMAAKGYVITENINKKGTLNGYNILMQGQTMTESFKGIPASQVNRNICAGRLFNLWMKVHGFGGKQISHEPVQALSQQGKDETILGNAINHDEMANNDTQMTTDTTQIGLLNGINIGSSDSKLPRKKRRR